MKLEFLAEGAPDCPLIRIYSFTRAEALRLKEIADQLADSRTLEVALHDESFVEPIDACCLTLRREKRDQGVFQFAPLRFNCVLSDKGWLNFSGLLQPFCETDANGFQWLSEQGPISFLMSVNGTW